MPKLDIANAKSSKLNQDKQHAALGVINHRKTKQKPTSIRLTAHDKQLLVKLANVLNEHTNRRVSESDVVRALIFLGSETKIEHIVKAYRNSS